MSIVTAQNKTSALVWHKHTRQIVLKASEIIRNKPISFGFGWNLKLIFSILTILLINNASFLVVTTKLGKSYQTALNLLQVAKTSFMLLQSRNLV